MHTVPLLISLAVGYVVLVLAKRETKQLALLGRIIGWVIIAVSTIGLLCTAACALYRLCPRHRLTCESAVSCPFMGHRRACLAPEQLPSPDEEEGEKK